MDYQDVIPDVTEVERVISSLNQQPVAHDTVVSALRVLAFQVFALLAATEDARRRLEGHDGEIAALVKAQSKAAAAK